MTKLIIQIPCYNEEATLPQTLADLPRELPGIDAVEWLVVDDGSTDRTAIVARALGVDHIVRHTRNQGLARAFRSGVDACLRLGADIIVNTDGDNQYPGAAVGDLIAPILIGQADITIGDRQVSTVAQFSSGKKLLQKLGSFVVRLLSGTNVPDAVSGFRAFSRKAALQINILSTFSYTTESIIQAGKKGLAVVCVPIKTNIPTRQSRLFKSIPQFLRCSAFTIARTYAMYQPLRVFCLISTFLILAGAAPIARFLYNYLTADGDGHIQSLVLGGVLVTMGFMSLLVGLLAELISSNRQLLEITLEKVRRLESAAENPGLLPSEPSGFNDAAIPANDGRFFYLREPIPLRKAE